jgi:hypothetical protein
MTPESLTNLLHEDRSFSASGTGGQSQRHKGHLRGGRHRPAGVLGRQAERVSWAEPCAHVAKETGPIAKPRSSSKVVRRLLRDVAEHGRSATSPLSERFLGHELHPAEALALL